VEKTYPSDERVQFILCEDVRQEMGNRYSALGIYGGDVLIVEKLGEGQSLDTGVSLASLATIFTFVDGQGQFDGSFELVAPDGTVQMRETFGQLTKPSMTHRMNVISVLKPFALHGLGMYKAAAILDGKRYEREFKINVRAESATAN